MSIFHSVPWRAPPHGPVGANGANPLTRGMLHLFNPRAGRHRSPALVPGTPRLIARPNGYALSPLGTETGYHSPQPGGEVSFLAVIARNLLSYSDTVGDALFRYGSASFGSAFGTGLSLPGYANGVVLRFAVRQASGAGDLTIDDTVAASSGSAYQIVIARYRKNEIFDLNINGVITTGTPTANAVDSTFYNRIYTGGPGNTNSQGGLYFAASWNRLISEKEVAALLYDPEQIFAPLPRRIWVPVSAGGGGTTISGALGTATASGHTGTVNANCTISGALGTATATGFQGTVTNNSDTTIAGSLGTAVASGLQGTVTSGTPTTITGSLGTAVASGFTGTVTWNRYIAGVLGVATASGFTGGVANGTAEPTGGSTGGSGGGTTRQLLTTKSRRDLHKLFDRAFEKKLPAEEILEEILPKAPTPEQIAKVRAVVLEEIADAPTKAAKRQATALLAKLAALQEEQDEEEAVVMLLFS